MLEYQKKHKVKKFIYSKLSLVLLLICIGFLFKGVIGLHAKAEESEKNKLTAEAEYHKLVAREADVSAQIADLKTPQGVEKEIRTKFNVAKEGEQMLVLVDEKKEEEFEVEEKPKGFFGKMKGFFTRDKKE